MSFCGCKGIKSLIDAQHPKGCFFKKVINQLLITFLYVYVQNVLMFFVKKITILHLLVEFALPPPTKKSQSSQYSQFSQFFLDPLLSCEILENRTYYIYNIYIIYIIKFNLHYFAVIYLPQK